MNINDKLKGLREKMKELGITAYIEPTSDPHQSEYVADYYKGRAWISGFTGSAGTVVVTMDEAILWTDGRYFIQAEKQIENSEFKLYKMNTPGFPTYIEYLSNLLVKNNKIGFNGKVFAQNIVEDLVDKLKGKNIEFVDQYDLIGDLWIDRPELHQGNSFLLDVRYSGKSTKDKILEIRKHLEEKEADNFLLASLDDIAWLYNIRGKDVPNNPIIISYALVSKDKAYLFVDAAKLSKETINSLKNDGIEIKGYEEVVNFVESIDKEEKIILEKSRINRWLYNAIKNQDNIINEMNITTILKGIKNPVEIENQKKAYIKDGIALVKFFHWIDRNIDSIEISEMSASDRLLKFRQEQEGFIEPSFDTISAYAANAAMMHYSANEQSNAIFQKEGLYLVDSGGQYYDGTTDITRTVALGPITDEEMYHFTLTLKGHINLISAKFLEGTSGHVLDVLCRYPLWQAGIDYKCGTGHGVGYLLNVHEGPHRIATAPNNIAMNKGMVVTIEPGVYIAGEHGIRIENVVVVKEDVRTESGQFLSFEVLSYCPIDLDCIDEKMLSASEKQWINNYHNEVYDKLSPYLNEEENKWLRNETRSI